MGRAMAAADDVAIGIKYGTKLHCVVVVSTVHSNVEVVSDKRW
jgi:hypothetical protein